MFLRSIVPSSWQFFGGPDVQRTTLGYGPGAIRIDLEERSCRSRWAKGPVDLATDPAGNVLLASHFRGNVNFGGGTLQSTQSHTDDALLVKLDTSGKQLWSKAVGGIAADYAYGVAADNKAAVYVTGRIANKVDFGGGPLYATSYSSIFLAKIRQ